MAYEQEIQDLYRRKLGRAPDARELESEIENAGKYGLGQLESNLTERAASNGGGGGGGQPQYATPTQAWNTQPTTLPQSSKNSELYSLLMGRAQQGTGVDSKSLDVRQQVDPATAQMERASRNYLDDLAEKAGPLANIQGERRLASERLGQQAGAFEAEIIGREKAARREEIQQALTLWGSMMSNEQQLALQKELAQLSAQERAADRELQSRFQSQSLAQQQDQFLKELALREWDTTQGWDYRWQTLGA